MDYIEKFIDKNIKDYDYWGNDSIKDYHKLSNKKKGDLGELIVQTEMRDFGHSVNPSTKGYNGTDDRLISNWHTEIKFSVTEDMKEDYFMINHVKKNIKWDRFIFYGYNKNKPHRFVWCTLEDMKKCWEETNFWSNQSSPEEFMCTGKNVIKWINSDYTRDIKEWSNESAPLIGLEEFF